MNVDDVEFRRDGDHGLLARIYRPDGEGPFPLLIDVHGGVWTSGSRTSNARLDEAIARTGVVVAAVDFRQPPDAGYPASIADIHFAVRWLRAHAAEFSVRPERIGALGHSTGGHQVLLVALRPDDPRYRSLALADGDAGELLSYGVLCWPIVDPVARYRWARKEGRTRLVEGHDRYWGSEEAMAEGNPRRIVDEGDFSSLPPLLVVQGTADENIPYTIVQEFAAAYRRAGGSIALELYEGAPHSFVNADPDGVAARRAIRTIIDFVHRQAT